MVTVSKESLNLQLPLIVYSSIRFVFETVFISEQIAENRFGALLEISDKFITEFNVFSYMVLQFRLKIVWKISEPYSLNLKKSGLVVLLERSQFVPQMLGIKLLGMGKDMEMQHSVSSPPYKVQGNFFCKKALHGGTNVLDQIYGGMFYMGTNDHILQGGVNG